MQLRDPNSWVQSSKERWREAAVAGGEESAVTDPRTRKAARNCLKHLLETFELPFKVRFRWNAHSPDSRAESSVRTVKSGQRWATISLFDGTDEYTTELLVLHEFAHLMAWDYPGLDNDAVWAIAYREVYSTFFGAH